MNSVFGVHRSKACPPLKAEAFDLLDRSEAVDPLPFVDDANAHLIRKGLFKDPPAGA